MTVAKKKKERPIETGKRIILSGGELNPGLERDKLAY